MSIHLSVHHQKPTLIINWLGLSTKTNFVHQSVYHLFSCLLQLLVNRSSKSILFARKVSLGNILKHFHFVVGRMCGCASIRGRRRWLQSVVKCSIDPLQLCSIILQHHHPAAASATHPLSQPWEGKCYNRTPQSSILTTDSSVVLFYIKLSSKVQDWQLELAR